jgi:hypothetical protein
VITSRTWPGLPHQRYLLVFAMRGHRSPPPCAELTPERLAAETLIRRRPSKAKRWMSAEIGDLFQAVVRSCCERRGGKCLDALVCSSCALACVELPPMSQYGLCDAVRLVTTRRAQRAHGWPRGERVFSKQVRVDDAQGSDDLALLRARLPALSSL